MANFIFILFYFIIYIPVFTYKVNKVGGHNLKTVSCKLRAFCRNAIHFGLLYSGFLLSIVQTFYIQRISCISYQCNGYVFDKIRTFGSLPNMAIFANCVCVSRVCEKKCPRFLNSMLSLNAYFLTGTSNWPQW